jgi:predicted acetyltransferase
MFQLVCPAEVFLPRYVHALQQGWSPDNLRPETARDHLAQITRDARAFISALDDREAKGAPVTLPDGSSVPRLPGVTFWMWDGDFCGSIGFRWQRGTAELPAYCLGHIGYSVVPWKRRCGYGTQALQLLLPYARQEGLPYVELTTDADNVASRKVIEANGGVLTERFHKPAAYGGTESLRFRIRLT